MPKYLFKDSIFSLNLQISSSLCPSSCFISTQKRSLVFILFFLRVCVCEPLQVRPQQGLAQRSAGGRGPRSRQRVRGSGRTSQVLLRTERVSEGRSFSAASSETSTRRRILQGKHTRKKQEERVLNAFKKLNSFILLKLANHSLRPPLS